MQHCVWKSFFNTKQFFHGKWLSDFRSNCHNSFICCSLLPFDKKCSQAQIHPMMGYRMFYCEKLGCDKIARINRASERNSAYQKSV